MKGWASIESFWPSALSSLHVKRVFYSRSEFQLVQVDYSYIGKINVYLKQSTLLSTSVQLVQIFLLFC